MPVKAKVETHNGIQTVWGKIISENEGYKYLCRTMAAFSANVFQVMRILEPDYDKRTLEICEIARMMNMSVAGTDERQKQYITHFYDEWNIPEFTERSSWMGALFGDSGDETQDMAGRVIEFTPDRVEKELDTCPWDIVGSEMCRMTTAMFMANFDLCSSNGTTNEMALDMCEAKGCGDLHCRIVAERKDVYNREDQGPLDHMGQPVGPVRSTPRERMFKEGQLLRNGAYENVFGEERSMEFSYNWTATTGWVWCVVFPMMAIREMAESEEEFLRIFKIVFSAAGKSAFIDPFAVEGMRSWLGVPHEIDSNDGRLMGGYIKALLDMQLVPNEIIRFDEEEIRIQVDQMDFIARYPMAPMEEFITGYEALWHNMVKTMVSTEWSCWIEGQDEDEITIVVAKKIDKYMV